MGDVVRTTPLIPVIARRFQSYHLTWLVDKKSIIFLRGNTAVHRILTFEFESALRLMIEEFDILFSLDKEVRATSMASLVKAKKKFGFGFHPLGNIYPFNPEAEYSFALGMSDQIKFFENKKTYQREILDTLGFSDEEYGMYQIPWNNFDLKYGQQLFAQRGIKPRQWVIGLNTGAGEIFATKRYWQDHFVALIRKISAALDATILLLGGPSEKERNQYLMEQCTDVPNLIHTGCDNPLEKFMGILNSCDVVVTGDTMALHLALSLRKRVLALFGSTCAQEIDMYELGEKIVSLPPCAPCYKTICPWEGDKHMLCMRQITPSQVFDAIIRQTEMLKQERKTQ